VSAMADTFNAAEYLVTRHVAAGAGGRTAVLASETLTYADLDERVGVVAAGLRALGLRRDDRVMLVMSDEVPMLTGILGAFRAGLVAVPVSTMFTGAELGKIMADSGARAVLATPEFADAVGQAIAMAPDVEHAVLAGDGTLALPDTVTGHT
jgi:acyl-CoA synthetase (AMP-forming)/AMP-acid ligase II